MLTLTLTLDSPIPLEAEPLTPDGLQPLSIDAIAALPVQHGNRTLSVREVFDIAGDPADGQIEIVGDCSRVKWLGQGMKSGLLTIRGAAGMHTGAAMRGGVLTITQNAGDWLGAEMRGGLIRVHGDAGHNAGAAYRGSEKGMRGGTILIHGNAGHEVGVLMRRGLIAVAGACGPFTGHAMIAGTIMATSFGASTGAGMKRGSLVAFSSAVEVLPTFRYDCEYEPVFLAMYFAELQRLGFPITRPLETRSYRRYSGDRLALGQGEVLIPV